MELHNISKAIVFAVVDKLLRSIAEQGNPEKLCLSEQCRMDTVCYTLNRIEPRYVISSRGINHLDHNWGWKQQIEADVASIALKGLRMVSNKQRPASGEEALPDPTTCGLYFEIPTISGRVFDGKTFAPLAGIKVELWQDGKLVPMRNHNWQNPCLLVANTPGTYTFWPAPVQAESADEERVFSYSLKVQDPGYETIAHFFKAPAAVSSPFQANSSRPGLKLPDIYLFPPGEVEMSD
ncbi:MAG: late competence development ComFB family protein [Treponema sp.]|jgi:competence protein ComFB|nr:late competence development ComFB family protein [Treponema sp.]